MRFSGEQYDQLWKIGFITSDDRVELLDGHFIKKPESTPQHIYALLELYARDNITEYWIVTLEQHQLEVYRDPDGTRYATSFTVKNAKPTACLAFPDDAIEWS